MNTPGDLLVIHVVSARGLTYKGNKPADVYCSLSTTGKGPWKSKVTTNAIRMESIDTITTELKWDEHCEFHLNESDTKLVLNINHKTIFGTTETLGTLLFNLSQMVRFQPPAWFQLTKVNGNSTAEDRGQIQLGYQFSNSLGKRHYDEAPDGGNNSTSISNLSLDKIEKEKKFERFRRKIQHFGRKAIAVRSGSSSTGYAAADDTQSMASISIAAGQHIGISRRSSISSNNSGALAFSSPSPNPTTPIPLNDETTEPGDFLSSAHDFPKFRQSLSTMSDSKQGQQMDSQKDNSQINISTETQNEPNHVRNKSQNLDTNSSDAYLASKPLGSTQKLRVKMRQKAEQLLQLRSLAGSRDGNSVRNHQKMEQQEIMLDFSGHQNPPGIQQTGRRDSITSSGFVSFGSGQLSALNEQTSPEHLLNVIRHLRRELLKKEERIRDLEEYTDHMLNKVMLSHPELLAASPKLGEPKKRNH